MAGKVLEFKAAEVPHSAGEAICSNCKHQWVTVAPAECRNLECPSCHAHRGVFKWPYGPSEGEESYQCNCGSEDFFVMRRGGRANGAVFCRGCGVEATGWFS